MLSIPPELMGVMPQNAERHNVRDSGIDYKSA